MTQAPTPPPAPGSGPGTAPPAPSARPRRSWRRVLFKWLSGLIVLAALVLAGYLFFVLKWSYSSGERAGWVQKLSHKGWFCKTWEGELAMVSMPGATPEKFFFTVWDDVVAEEINRQMGKRVALHYEEKIGIPTTCFGETRHFVTRVTVVDQIPLAPGIVVPTPPSSGSPATPPASAPAAPAPTAPASSVPSPAAPSPSAPSPSAPAPDSPATGSSAPGTPPQTAPVPPATSTTGAAAPSVPAGAPAAPGAAPNAPPSAPPAIPVPAPAQLAAPAKADQAPAAAKP